MKPEENTNYARWLNEELSKEELEALKSSGELEALEAIVQVTENLRLPAYDVEKAYDQFKSKHPKKKAKIISFPSKWVIGIAASFLIILASIFILSDKATNVKANFASNEKHTFLDASSVVLNDGSSILFDENNWNKERKIELMGEAFFEVKKGKPFSVETKNGSVQVLGTSFNVRAWGDKLSVECYSGSVKVRGAGQDTILIKNQFVEITNGQMNLVETFDHQSPIWSTGVSKFKNEDLSEVFKEMERQFNVQIQANNIKNKFTGTFEHDDLELALRKVCSPYQLKISYSKDKKEVIIKR